MLTFNADSAQEMAAPDCGAYFSVCRTSPHGDNLLVLTDTIKQNQKHSWRNQPLPERFAVFFDFCSACVHLNQRERWRWLRLLLTCLLRLLLQACTRSRARRRRSAPFVQGSGRCS